MTSRMTSRKPPQMTLAGALRVVLPLLQDELVVHANGFIARESFNLEDRLGNFYMIGSMGLARSPSSGQPRL